MHEPEPKPDTESAQADTARSPNPALRAGEIDARDPAVAEAAEIADQVGANA